MIANTLSIASKSSQISDKHLSVAYAGEMIQQRPLEPTSPPSSTRRRPFPHFSEGKSGSPTFFPQFSPETATMTDTNTMEALAELFGTSTKNAAIRAVKLKLTPVCGRCCGTGAYSFNQIDGDRCFGCHGSGHAAVAPSNIASVVAAARLAIADGRHARYLDALANQRQAAEMSKRIFEAWRASAAARGNPSHTLRDEDCTEQQLRCRRANARIAAAYEALTPLDVAHKRNPTDDDHVAWKNALDTFFAVIAETDALLSEAGVAA
ncbi:MAG: hypothetical protein H6872_05730 [Methylobacteriaceae bacterium]|nr:hypothetical protein [Methylobacteriaceae bacterium]